MQTAPTCFVVMPYGKRPVDDVVLDFDVIFDEFIAPATRAAGFEVLRSDRELASGVVMRRVFSAIQSAELVIADVTYQNPNVYYELGVRHALRPQGTLLIRRAGGDLGVHPLEVKGASGTPEAAFDIQGVTILSYQPLRNDLPAARTEFCRQIQRVAGDVRTDSPAYLYLDGLRVVTDRPRAHPRDDRTYEILSAGSPIGRFIGYRSGDIKELRNERAVDFWVNSENVLMQMARIYERSVSSTIRWLGAFQPDPRAPDYDDTIALDLVRQMGARHAVDQGEVLVTTSGKLRSTHGVKAVLHAAVVTGAPGRGFDAISDDLIIETARSVLSTARGLIQSGRPELLGRSLLMPLFGTGQGRSAPLRSTERLLQEAIGDLAAHAARVPTEPDLELVVFSTFTKDHVTLLQRCLDSLEEGGVLRRVSNDIQVPR